MFGIQLGIVQKLELAFVCVVLGIAGVFIFKSVQPPFDSHITAWTVHRAHPVMDNAMHSLPVTTTNPRDPKKDETAVIIAVSDGKLEVSKYPNDPGRHVMMVWKPERRQPGLVYQYYRDPMERIEDFKDAFRHALAFAVYNQVYARNLKLLGSANMTSEQTPKEASAREQMNNEIKVIDAGVEAGTFQPALLAKVAAALDAYDAAPGDPSKDKLKADLVRKLLETATAYFDAVARDKDAAIDKYMGTIENLLTSDQKQKVVESYDSYVQSTRPATPNRMRGGVALTPRTAPARGAGTAPARGGGAATARGGRAGTTTVPRAGG